MNIKNIHFVATHNKQVILVNNNGVLELPGAKLQVTHHSEKSAIKEFIKTIVEEIVQQNVKVKDKEAKKMLNYFEKKIVSKKNDLVLYSKNKKAFNAVNEIANTIFPNGSIHIPASELKKGIKKADTQYDAGVQLSKEAREALRKALK